MEFDRADLAQDPLADPHHPYADYAQLAGRWFLVPLAAIAGALALVELFAALTQRKR